MSSSDKIAEAMRRSMPHLPLEALHVVEGMLRPESIAMISGTLAVWAGSHFFGVGEMVDIILLGVGTLALGFSMFEGAGELYEFCSGAVAANTSAQLDEAGRHFARAATILGISTVQAVLLRGQGRTLRARGRPRLYPREEVAAPPPAGDQLRIARPRRLPDGEAGRTSPYGEIEISRSQSVTDERVTLYHELVHRYFSPRTGPLRQLRAEVRISAYSRSALLRYLEEALAEGYGQLRVHGLQKAMTAYRFPVEYGYVTVAQMVGEGQVVGTIALGGVLFHVSISHGPMPR
jgi:hypothetical protein